MIVPPKRLQNNIDYFLLLPFQISLIYIVTDRAQVLYELSKEKSDLALPASVVDISPQKKRRSGDSSPVKASSPMKKIKLEPTSPVKHNSITDFIVRSPKKLNSNQSSSRSNIVELIAYIYIYIYI